MQTILPISTRCGKIHNEILRNNSILLEGYSIVKQRLKNVKNQGMNEGTK